MFVEGTAVVAAAAAVAAGGHCGRRHQILLTRNRQYHTPTTLTTCTPLATPQTPLIHTCTLPLLLRLPLPLP